MSVDKFGDKQECRCIRSESNVKKHSKRSTANYGAGHRVALRDLRA